MNGNYAWEVANTLSALLYLSDMKSKEEGTNPGLQV